VLARTLADGVAHINIGTNEVTSKLAVEIADAHEGSWAIVGLHPIQAAGGDDEDAEDKGGTPPVLEVETVNLDYYRALGPKSLKWSELASAAMTIITQPKTALRLRKKPL
jgi:Tat protein secretion system quality control protein TatD with DNase activity